MKKIILAITGASGCLYIRHFLDLMEDIDVEIHGIISSSGRQVLHLEQGLKAEELPGVAKWFAEKDFTAPMASGSSNYQGMVVLPCTMGSLAAIANGLSINLIHRAADVMLKEKKPLILAVRETPLNRNHLENMLRAHDAGATICPPMPAFYNNPQSLQDLALHFAGRLASQLGIDIPGLKQWQGIPQ